MDNLNLFLFGQEPEEAEPVADSEDRLEEEETPEEPEQTEQTVQTVQEEPYRVYHSKEEWQEEFDGILGKRLKNQREMQEKLADYEAKLSQIAAVYNTDISGIDGKLDQLIEDRAYEEGTTAEELKSRMSQEQEFRQLRQLKQQMERQKDLERFSQAVTPEIEKLKKKHPGLYGDLSADAITTNPLFLELLAGGYSLEKAYEMLHVDKVKDYVRRSTRATVANNIKARGTRPVEGAGKAFGSGAAKLDIANLTSEEMRDIRERVRRGEKITFQT